MANDNTVGLLFKLAADSTDARGDISNFTGFLKNALSSMKSLFASFSDSTGSLGLAAGTVEAAAALTTTAVFAAAGAVAVLVQHAANADERIFDLTQKTGLQAEALAAMKLSADTAGVSIEQVSSFVTRFEKSLADAAGGNQQLAQTFKQLGIDVQEGLRNPQAAFDSFLKKFNQLSDDAAKVQLVQKLGGRGGAELLQFLKDGADGVDGFIQRAKALGVVLPSVFDAQQADRFNDTLTNIQNQFDGLLTTVGRDLLPVIQPLLDSISASLAQADTNAKSFGESLASGLQESIDTGGALASLFGEIINTVRDLLLLVDDGTDNAVGNVGRINDSFGPIREFIVFLTGGVALIEDLVRLTADVVIGAIKEIALALDSVPQGFLALFGIVNETLESEVKRLRDDIGALNSDFDLGLRRTREIGRQIAEARAQAAALAGGFVETEIGPDGRVRPKGTANVRQFSATSSGTAFNPPTKTGKSKDDSEAESRAELKQLELAEKARELLFKQESDAVKLELAQRLIAHDTYTKQLIRIEEVRLQSRLAFIAEESKQVEASNLKQRDKDTKLEELRLKVAEERRKSEEAVNNLKEQQRQLDLQAERAHQQALLDLELAADRQRIDQIRVLQNQRIIGNVAAEKRIAEIEQQSFDRRQAALEKERQLVGPDANEFQVITDKLAKLNSDHAAAVEASAARIGAARSREIADQQAFQQAMTRSEQELLVRQIELERKRLDALESRTTTASGRASIINARADNERAAEALRHQQALDSLLNQENELQDQAQTYKDVLRVTEQFDRKFEEEKQRHNQALQILGQQQEEANAANDPSSNLNTFGISDESLSGLDAFAAAAQQAFASVANSGLTMKSVLTDVFKGLASATQSVLQNFILTGQGGAQAFKSLAAAVISSLAIQAGIKAVFEVAEGVKEQALASGSAAVGDVAGAAFHTASAAQHFAAAKFFGLLGGGAAALGIGIGAAGGLGGGNDNSSQAQGAGAFGGQQQSKESKFTSGDATGKLGLDADSQTHGVLQPIFDKISGVYDLHRQVVEDHKQALDRQTAVQERHAQAAESLVTRISSIPPEDSLAIAVDRAPEHIGRGLDAATTRDSGVTRNLALKLGVA